MMLFPLFIFRHMIECKNIANQSSGSFFLCILNIHQPKERSRCFHLPIALIAVALILVWALTEACNAPAFAQSHDQLGELPRSFVSVPDPVVALEHVSLIDGTGAPPVADQTVLIGNGRIHAIGPTDSIELPERARRLDLRGSTVLPGIVGVHNHIHYSAIGWRTLNLTISSPRLYLASGVTTIRVAGSYAPYQDLNLRRSIDSGREPGHGCTCRGLISQARILYCRRWRSSGHLRRPGNWSVTGPVSGRTGSRSTPR